MNGITPFCFLEGVSSRSAESLRQQASMKALRMRRWLLSAR